jgi:hypothetical protein
VIGLPVEKYVVTVQSGKAHAGSIGEKEGERLPVHVVFLRKNNFVT